MALRLCRYQAMHAISLSLPFPASFTACRVLPFFETPLLELGVTRHSESSDLQVGGLDRCIQLDNRVRVEASGTGMTGIHTTLNSSFGPCRLCRVLVHDCLPRVCECEVFLVEAKWHASGNWVTRKTGNLTRSGNSRRGRSK
jgi:hypothetical protein